jgi:hypothetical protein
VTDWSRDGKYLLFSQDDPRGSPDLWALTLEGDRKPIVVLQTPFVEVKGQFSPDGKWVAYDSNSSGGFEVHIRAFPSSATQWQISNRGGTDPRWRGDGKELFYLSPNKTMMAVTIRMSGTSIEADVPHELFPARGLQHSQPRCLRRYRRRPAVSVGRSHCRFERRSATYRGRQLASGTQEMTGTVRSVPAMANRPLSSGPDLILPFKSSNQLRTTTTWVDLRRIDLVIDEELLPLFPGTTALPGPGTASEECSQRN